MVGTIRSSTFSMACAKNLALGVSAKYSSQALESTRFIRGPCRVECGCRCRGESPSYSSCHGPGQTRSCRRIRKHRVSGRAEDEVIHERCGAQRAEILGKG